MSIVRRIQSAAAAASAVGSTVQGTSDSQPEVFSEPFTTEVRILAGVVFTICPSFNATETRRLSNIVHRHGGNLSPALRKGAMLVTRSVKSPLYSTAISIGVECVAPEWLSSVHRNGTIPTLGRYAVTGLVGCVVVVTGATVNEREDAELAVKKLRGEWSASLEKGVATHLIVYGHPSAYRSSPKYKHARRWNLQIVTTEWLQQCTIAGKLVEEEFYSVPAQSDEEPICPAANDVEPTVSATLPLSAPTTTAPFSTSAPRRSSVGPNRSSIRATILSGDELSSAAQLRMMLSTTTDHPVVTINRWLLDHVSISALPSPNTIQGEPFLGRNFYIEGFSTPLTDYIWSVILAAGGWISPVLVPDVQVVLLGKHSSDITKRALTLMPVSMEHANLLWLLSVLFPSSTWLPVPPTSFPQS